VLDPQPSPDLRAAASPRFYKHDGHMTKSAHAALGHFVLRALGERTFQK
jgi:hypothetical protein